MKVTKCCLTQITKFITNYIVRVAEYYNITGNAYIFNFYYHPNFLTQIANKKFWYIDFQMNNLSCLKYIQATLKVLFVKKFSKKKLFNKS